MFKHTSSRTNLCPDRPSAVSALVPAVPPREMPVSPGFTPLVSLNGILIVCDGDTVCVDGRDGMPLRLGFTPRTAVQTGPCTFIVLSDSSAKVIDVDPDTLELSVHADFDRILPSLRAVDAGLVYASVAPVRCNVGEIQAGALADADSRRFARAACDAYKALSEAAASQGLCIHPRLARVRALSPQGVRLFITEPVLLAHPSLSEFNGRFEFVASQSVAGFAEADDACAPAWKPQLCIPDSLLKALPPGTVVEVLVSDPVPAFDVEKKAVVAPRRRSSDPLVRVSLAMSAVDVFSMALDADMHMRRGWSTRMPQSCQSFSFSHGPVLKVTSGARLKTALSGASTASAVVWASPVAQRPEPPGADAYAVAVEDKPWHSAVAVEFADGSVSVTVSSGSTGAPSLFSPLICYPAPDAVAVSITVSSGGEVRHGRFPLVASAGSHRAVWFSPEMTPSELPGVLDSFVPPLSSPAVRAFPASVAVASALNPLQPFAFFSPGVGKVHAVISAVVGQSAWDYGRSRFYVFASDGIYLLSVDPSKCTVSASLIDSRVVESQHAVVRIGAGIAAIASGDIVMIKGRNVEKIHRNVLARALAWVNSHKELWCICGDAVEVVCLENGGLRYSVPAVYDVWALQASPETTYIRRADGRIFVAGHGQLRGSVPVRFVTELPVPVNVSRYPILRLDIPGRYESLDITVTRTDTLGAAPAPDFKADVSGRISAPLRFVLPLPASVRSIRLEISGIAAPDSRFISYSVI